MSKPRRNFKNTQTMENPAVSKFIASTPEPQRAQMLALRSWLHDLYPHLKESMKWGRPVFSLEKDLVYFKPTIKLLTLGFFAGDKVRTQPEMLEGTGAGMRHIKIDGKGHWNRELVAIWLEEMQA